MGDIGVLPIRFRKPDAVPLGELSGMIRRSADAPIEASKFHRNLIALAKCPLIIRRLVWEYPAAAPAYARNLVSRLSRAGKPSLARHERRCPCLLSYGPTDSLGQVTVR